MSNRLISSMLELGRVIFDGWYNPFTGFGTNRDRSGAGGFSPDNRLPDETLTNLFNHDDIAGKVISLPAEEMFREGYILETSDQSAADQILRRSEDLDLEEAFEDGIRWGRLYGGAVLFIGADDGHPADTPLRPALVRSVDFLDVFDRRRVWPWRYCKDPRNPRYGKPEVYALQSIEGPTSYVHFSRLILFRGARTDVLTRRMLDNWDYSILQKTYETIRAFNECFRAMQIMMTEASIGVFSMKGLISMIAGGQRQLLETRAQMLDMGKSVARSIFLDSEGGESFTRVGTQFAGVADQLTQAAKRLSAATDIPVIVLMGETPSGLNASGDANVRLWYDRIKSYQIKNVVPKILRVQRLIGQSLNLPEMKYALSPRQLWQETPKEKEDRKLVTAQRDQIYIANEVYTPEEVVAVRGRANGFDTDIVIDPENRLGGVYEREPEP